LIVGVIFGGFKAFIKMIVVVVGVELGEVQVLFFAARVYINKILLIIESKIRY